MKKILVLGVLCFYIILSFSIKIRASEQDNRDLLYQRAFETDSIIVISNNSQEYKVNDFCDIKANEILHLSNRYEMRNIVEKKFDNENIYKIDFEGNGKEDVLNVIDMLSEREDIIYAGPNYIYDTFYTVPNDTYYGLNSIAYSLVDLQSAWEISTGSSEVRVGIIDSGINANFPELSGHYDSSLSESFCEGELPPNSDALGHGTSVASIIAATNNNSYGTTGVCWDVKVVSLKICNTERTFTTASVVSAINYANDNSIPILNMSIGFDYDLAIKTAIDNYYGLVVCAAGNEGREINSFFSCYPAAFDCDNILSVGSCTTSGTISSFSNVSQEHIDVFAPGEGLVAVYPCMGCDDDSHVAQNFHTISGTSYSSPFVAGIAALLLSKYPHLSYNDIKNTILNNVELNTNCTYLCTSGGIINAYNALINPSHSHSYTIYAWRSTTQHLESCACGVSRFRGHTVLSGQTICILCNGRADFGILQPSTLSNDTEYITPNGSFVLPNGNVILNEADLKGFLNNTLDIPLKKGHSEAELSG